MQADFDFTGKTALVTGASSGIGAATAELLARCGAAVGIAYHSNKSGADELVSRIGRGVGRVQAFKVDVRKIDEIQNLVRAVESGLGPIDILVNNAGSLVRRSPIRDLTEAAWDEVLNLNLKSAVFCTQAVAAGMIARRSGAIVNIGSIAGHNGGGPGAGPYAASKAGLVAITKSLAKELAPHGIRVNAIAPGVIDTPFHEVFSTPDMMRNFVSQIPLGRIGTPAECASAIAFLASDAASYIVGETLEVNGGQMMR